MPARLRVVVDRLRLGVQAGHQRHELAHRHLGHQPAGLQHGADPAGLHRVVGVGAEHRDLPAGGLAQREQHVQGSGLARAVRAEQGHRLARPQVQVELVNRLQAAEMLGDVHERDNRSAAGAAVADGVGACFGCGVTRRVVAHHVPCRCPVWFPLCRYPHTTIAAGARCSAVPQRPAMTCVIGAAVTRDAIGAHAARRVQAGERAVAAGIVRAKGREPGVQRPAA